MLVRCELGIPRRAGKGPGVLSRRRGLFRGAAGIAALGIFNNTEFLLLTLISMTQAVIGSRSMPEQCGARST